MFIWCSFELKARWPLQSGQAKVLIARGVEPIRLRDCTTAKAGASAREVTWSGGYSLSGVSVVEQLHAAYDSELAASTDVAHGLVSQRHLGPPIRSYAGTTTHPTSMTIRSLALISNRGSPHYRWIKQNEC